MSYGFAAIDTNCNYVSNNTTFYDNAYPIPVLYPSVVPANVMQSAYEYYHEPQCSNIFTAGQGRRMREIIVNSPAQYYGAMPLGNALTFVADLYQPYAKDLVIATNMPSRIYDHGGSATVCRYFAYDNYKFQKGFDYLFPDAEAPDLLSATTDQLPLVVNPMFNYPVTILQLAAGQTNLATNTGYVLNTCKSLICNEEPYTTGTKSFQSQILSTDVTTEMLSAVEINDPNFYINLENQKLYKNWGH